MSYKYDFQGLAQDKLYLNSCLSAEVTSSKNFDEIISAIISGKYSWACFLMLRWANYNPIQYIPYRTYNRLIKENSKKHQ
jgi:hypothetical protein